MGIKHIAIITLLLLLYSQQALGLGENTILNSSAAAGARVTIYEITDINFDHTFNTILITSKGSGINLDFSNEELFHIWEFQIEVDNEPYYYAARPVIEGEAEKYHFRHHIPIDGTRFVKVTFFMDNVKQDRAEWLYPFDSYSVFLRDRKIEDGTAKSVRLNFPQVDIESDINITYHTTITFPGYGDEINLSISPLIAGTKYSKIVSEVCLVNKKVCNLDVHLYNPQWEEIQTSSEFQLVSENTEISFSRNNFSKFLFVIIAIYFVFITLYFISKKKSFKSRMYSTYVQASILPWIMSEFTVGLAPPYRPISVTLFDLIIFLPMIIIVLASIFKK